MDVGFQVKSHPHWITCRAGDVEQQGCTKTTITHLHTGRHRPGLAGRQEVSDGAGQHKATQWLYLQSVACVCVPVLAVLAVVVVSAVADVSVGGAGLPVALSLVLTWIQMAGICAAFAIVA